MEACPPRAGFRPHGALAKKINVSRNTVVSAYQQLEVRAMFRTKRVSNLCRRGAQSIDCAPHRGTERSQGSAVQARTTRIVSQPMNFFGLAHRRSLQPELPDVTHFPFVTLRRIIAHRLQAGGDYVFGYQHIAGYPPLKLAIARYLAAARGVRFASRTRW